MDPVAIEKLLPSRFKPEEQEFSQILREVTVQPCVPAYVLPQESEQVLPVQVLAAHEGSATQPPQNMVPPYVLPQESEQVLPEQVLARQDESATQPPQNILPLYELPQAS
ncbi:MAG: hypothetical protein AAB519_00305 [Patescibacteria group bacterium]